MQQADTQQRGMVVSEFISEYVLRVFRKSLLATDSGSLAVRWFYFYIQDQYLRFELGQCN